MTNFLPLLALCLLAPPLALALKKGECEVCIIVVDKFRGTLTEDDLKDVPTIDKKFKKFCQRAKNEENRFCYYLAGTADTATDIPGEFTKPLSFGMPTDKVCENLNKKEKQVCELSYEKLIDISTIDLKKLRVKNLKTILNQWDESCDGCLEKSDFIRRIEELKPKHVGK
jgi:hypothetical protein